MKIEERRLKVDGLEIAAKCWGSLEGRPVLAMHGWLDNAASFDELVPLFGEGLQVVAIDLVGHGRSDWRGADGAYHFIDWVKVALDVSDALGWERFSILGHSMGAAIAALTGAVAPKRVERMVFLDGIGPWSMEPEAVVKQLRKGLAQERLLQSRKPRRFRSMEEMVEAFGRARKDLSPDKLEILARRSGREEEDGSWILSSDRRLQGSSRVRLTERQVQTFLEAIECPVLLVRPDAGWPVEEEMIKRRIGGIKELEVFEVEGGHHMHLEAPERVADKVGSFLRTREWR